MVASKMMQKKIHDQLEESSASKHLRSTAFEMALFGTGVMKGPFAVDKEYPSWGEDGVYSPSIKTIPQVSHVSVWNFYPDPDANNMDEAQFVIERHKMSRTQLRGLKKRPYFRSSVIDDAVQLGENYNKEYWEDDLSDYAPEHGVERYEVLEYWGMCDTEMLIEQGVDIPDDLQEVDELQANIWICNGNLGDRVEHRAKLSLVLNFLTLLQKTYSYLIRHEYWQMSLQVSLPLHTDRQVFLV